jgi:hypothetical protein
MQLTFNTSLASKYTSSSQKIRVLTEDWVSRTAFCPKCGQNKIFRYENNRPVADFYCQNCREEYELKSKKGEIGTKIVDGAYKTMIDRLGSSTNPNFFILSYNLSSYTVRNFLVIPKHFFVPEIIEKRKPLAETARRAGWVGCNILLNSIPEAGKVFIVRNGIIIPQQEVTEKWQRMTFLGDQRELNTKGWLLDVIRCIEKLNKKSFNLGEIYQFERELSILHPDNNHIKDKIRQQLQILRDKNYLEFTSRGHYRLI